ncbi:MAG: hypothetical protein JJT94_15695 [Bernardetiaceae bacterium]|nr:hypothetical protein [Bernardetiaceae bacterium]
MFISFSACVGQAQYSDDAYKRTQRIREETLQIMNRATEPFENYKNSAQNLIYILKYHYEEEKKRPQNKKNTELLAQLLDEKQGKLHLFLELWKENEKLPVFTVVEQRKHIIHIFDNMLENEKNKSQ